MMINNNLVQRTYYDILGVKEDASYEEIRSIYRSAILTSHPDKLLRESETFISEHKSGDKFIELRQAWETLSNPQARAMYDIELQSSRKDEFLSEDVSLEDFTVDEVDDDGLELFYNCRCGDYFVIHSSELTEVGYSLSKNGNAIILDSTRSLPASVVLPCGSCSHKIRVAVDVNVRLDTSDQCSS